MNSAQVFEVKSSTSAQDLKGTFFFSLNKIRRALWSSFFSVLHFMTHFVGEIVTSEAGALILFLFFCICCVQLCGLFRTAVAWSHRSNWAEGGGGGGEGEVSLKCNGKNSIIAFVVWRLKNINLVTCKSLTEIQF